jgi:hypothetical protein
MASGLRELITSLLAGLGFGLALARDDLFFLAVFGGASADRAGPGCLNSFSASISGASAGRGSWGK